MAITKDDAYHIAKLASLEITAEEADKYSKQLSDILDYAEALNKLDTSKIDPSFHGNIKSTLMREDEVEVFEDRQRILDNAIELSGTAFSVPKIL